MRNPEELRDPPFLHFRTCCDMYSSAPSASLPRWTELNETMSQGKSFHSQVTDARHLVIEKKTTNTSTCHYFNAVCLSGFYYYLSSHIVAVTYRPRLDLFIFIYFLCQLFKDKLAILWVHSLSLRKTPCTLLHRVITDFHIHRMIGLKSSRGAHRTLYLLHSAAT